MSALPQNGSKGTEQSGSLHFESYTQLSMPWERASAKRELVQTGMVIPVGREWMNAKVGATGPEGGSGSWY